MVAVAVVAADDAQSQFGAQLLALQRQCLQCVGLVALRDGSSLLPQCLDMVLHAVRQVFRHGDDQCLVACAGLRLQHTVYEGGMHEVALAGVVAVQSHGLQVVGTLFQLMHLRRQLVDVEHHHPVLEVAGILVHGVGKGRIDQHVVVGLSQLQEALHALNVFHHARGILPDAVRGTHVDGGIELPARPGSILRRVAGAVEQHVVDTAGEQQVQFGLYLRQRRTEMLCQPRHRLAGRQQFAGDVGCTRRVFQRSAAAQRIQVKALVVAQTLDAEAVQVEVLRLGDVGLGIQVYQVAGRAVRLVASGGSVAVRPLCPLAGEVLLEHVRQRLTVVGIHLLVAVQQLVQVLVELIAAARLKLLKHLRRPVGLVYLIRVVEEAVRPFGTRLRELRVEVFQVLCHGISVEIVDHQPLAAGRRTLHLHHPVLDVGGNNLPVAGGSLPLQALAADQVCQVRHVAAVARLGEGHHALQRAVRRVQRHRFLAGAVTTHVEGLRRQPAGRLRQFHHRSAERPPGAGGHVDVDTQFPAGLLGVVHHLQPFGRQEADVLATIVFYGIDGGDFQRADAGSSQLFHLPFHVVLVYGRTVPPPAAARLGLLGHLGPLWSRLCLHTAQYHGHQA